MIQATLDLPHPTGTSPAERHIATMRSCWPEWEGPRVEDSVHGLCQPNSCFAFSLTHGQPRYHAGAHCRIESISEDGSTIIAVIAYPPDSVCAHMNGERLRMDITEIWPPVFTLRPHACPLPNDQ